MFEGEREVGVKAFEGFGRSAGGCEWSPVSLLTEDECDRLVFGRWVSLLFGMIAGAA